MARLEHVCWKLRRNLVAALGPGLGRGRGLLDDLSREFFNFEGLRYASRVDYIRLKHA
jgi:hypothetical protein